MRLLRIISLTFIALISNCISAQDISSKGTEFWLGFMDHVNTTGAAMDLYITSDSSTTGTVYIDGQAWSSSFTVTANQVTVVSIPSTTAHVGCSDCIEDKGIRVETVKPVALYSHIWRENRSDATLVLPIEASGKKYRVMGWEQEMATTGGSRRRSQFMIVASTDNTKINITPTDVVEKVGVNHAANVMYSITLDKGEVYQGQAPDRYDDLSGTLIEVIDTGATASCKKIAVFSGSSGTSITCGGGIQSHDNLFEQLFPVNSWGKEFLVIPYLNRNHDRIRVVADQDNTLVLFNGSFVAILNAGQVYQSGRINTAQYIQTTKPASVAQFMTGRNCGGDGDPSMTMISPIQQTLKDVVVYSSEFEDIEDNYINVAMKTADTSTFTIDGQKVPFTTFSSASFYSYARITVNDGFQHLKSGGDGFVATAYGMDRWESYGYAAGANVKNLAAYFELDNNNTKTTVINTLCLGEKAEFKGNANYDVKKWEWFFGDDSSSTLQNPEHTYLDTGTYTVKMRVTKLTLDGCSAQDSSISRITVVNNPYVNFSFDDVCDGTTVDFKDSVSTDSPGTIDLKLWDFGDNTRLFGDDLSHLYDTAGRYRVSLRVRNSNECTVDYFDTVEINPIPEARFFASNACFMDSTILQDSSFASPHPVAEWIWDMGEGSIDTVYTSRHAFLYDTSGTFTIGLTINTSKGCSATADTLFTKHAEFKAAFSSTDECLKNTVDFQDTSETSGVNPTSRLWDFGDATNSTSKNNLHKYSMPGDYTAKLIITQNTECADSIEKTITIHKQVTPSFSIQNLCFKDSATLSASHSPNLEVVNNYQWENNGSTYSGDKWTHQFMDSGKNNFSLITTTANGCIDTLDTFAIINPKPFAEFTSNTPCENNEIELINRSNDFGSAFTKVSWYNTSANSTGIKDTFKYLLGSPAFENVELIVESGDGCSDTVTRSVKVWRSPQINISIADICSNESINATNTTTVDSSKINSWTWSLDDGRSSIDSIPITTYSAPGTKNATLTAISDKGCISQGSVQFEVNPLPVVSYTITESCLGTATQFANTSTISAGNIAQTLYTFGDANTSVAPNTTNTYALTGDFTTKLIATSNFGCKDSSSQTLKVHAIPVADFSATPLLGCLPLNVVFTDLSTVNNDAITEWEWSDNQGVFSTSQSADKTFITTGSKSATLKVKTAFGCENTISYPDLIEVYPKPIANFSFLPIQPTIIESTVTFTNLSVGSNGWDWSFGDGGSSTDENPVHTYADTGLYNVRLEITNSDNCVNDTTISLFIEPAFSVYVPNSFSPNGDGINDAWGPEGVLQGVKGYELLIFNRWGEIIFQTDNPNIKWDGTYQGASVPEGFYGYRMRYTDYFITKWLVKHETLFLTR